MAKIAEGRNATWILFHNARDGFLFAVLCGSIGLYERRIVLTKEEEHRFQVEGETFLDGLARDVSRNEHVYVDRFQRHQG